MPIEGVISNSLRQRNTDHPADFVIDLQLGGVPDQWDQELMGLESSNIFQSGRFLHIDHISGTERLYVRVLNRSGNLQGQVAVIEEYLGCKKKFVAPWLKGASAIGGGFLRSWRIKQGPLFVRDADPRSVPFLLTYLDTLARQRRIAIATISDPYPDLAGPKGNPSEFWSECGFRSDSWATSIVDLDRDLEEIQAGFHPSIRKNLRRCESFPLTWEQCPDIVGFRAYWEFLSDSRRELGMTTNRWEKYERLWTILAPNGLSAYVVRLKNQIVAAVGVWLWNGSAYPFGLCLDSDMRARGIPAGDYLHWVLIRALRDCGITRFDLGGFSPAAKPGSKEEGIRRFKKKWGGREIRYSRHVKAYNWVGRRIRQTVSE